MKRKRTERDFREKEQQEIILAELLENSNMDETPHIMSSETEQNLMLLANN